ncbi:hypothetical protein HZA44_03235 [Candidatus Peregrinibacteria bacterium]|nr:hypothetical protein [Candidatus Peregrinibacteria bacterium]
MDFELPKSPVRKPTQGLLEQLKEVTVEHSKKVFDWFKELFTKTKEKGLKATLMGPFVGFLNFMDSLGKNEPASKEEPQETVRSNPEIRGQLDTLRSALPSLFDHTQLESEPYEVSERTKVTLCSGTALKNLQKVGCTHFFSATVALKALEKDPEATFDGVPSGDAIDVMNFYKKSPRHRKIPGTALNRDLPAQLDTTGKYLADILVDSSSPYEHRAMAFKSVSDGHWYILDPYRADKSQKPIPFADYKGKIEFAVPLTADTAPAMALAARPQAKKA